MLTGQVTCLVLPKMMSLKKGSSFCNWVWPWEMKSKTWKLLVSLSSSGWASYQKVCHWAGKEEIQSYLRLGCSIFQVAASGVENDTQIHSHFCYSDLDPNHIKALDADVVLLSFPRRTTLTTSKSSPTTLTTLDWVSNNLHSKNSLREKFVARIEEILKVYPANKFWVNPDWFQRPEAGKRLGNFVDQHGGRSQACQELKFLDRTPLHEGFIIQFFVDAVSLITFIQH